MEIQMKTRNVLMYCSRGICSHRICSWLKATWLFILVCDQQIEFFLVCPGSSTKFESMINWPAARSWLLVEQVSVAFLFQFSTCQWWWFRAYSHCLIYSYCSLTDRGLHRWALLSGFYYIICLFIWYLTWLFNSVNYTTFNT